jgi:hypothetical protein
VCEKYKKYNSPLVTISIKRDNKPAILTGEEGMIPIEVKSSSRVTVADGRSVATFLSEHPETARLGIVAYPGDELVEIRENVWGVPDWYLLGTL